MTARFAMLALSALLGLAPLAAASREEFLATPFVENTTLNFENYRRFDLGETARTLQYGEACLPQAPCLHAFSLGHGLRDGNRFGPRFPYNLKFPIEFYGALPASVTALIERLGVPRERVQIFCVIQDQPYRDDVQELFRPQGWAYPKAPYQDRSYRPGPKQVSVAILEAPAGVRFSARPDGAFFSARIGVEPQAGGFILSTGPNLAVDGLDYHQSQAFWTVTQLDDQVAATLQILLNDADEQILESLAPAANVAELKQRMEASRLHGSAWLQQFQRLTRLEDAPDAPAAPAPAWDPALLWLGGPTRNLVIPMDGIAFEYQSRPCRPGEEFVGETQVQAAAGVRGRVRIGLRFDSDAKLDLGGGEAVPGTPAAAELPGRVRLAVRGKAPAGADRVTFFIRVEQGTPWSRVDFEGLSFSRPAPDEPQSNLWKILLTAPEKGAAGVYHSLPCAADASFIGEAYVRTDRMAKGKAQLGMVFQGGGKALRYGAPLGPDRPNESASPARVRLQVKGVAPKDTDTVQFFVQTHGCNPGAQATFEAVEFRQLPSGGPAPSASAAPPNLWKTTLKAPASGVAGQYLSLPCRPGEVFTGRAFVQTRGLTKGSARISVAFMGGGKAIRYAGALGHGVDFESRKADRVEIGTVGEAPSGTDTAQVYIQLYGANAGATATFDSITFHRRPAPAPPGPPPAGPVVAIQGGDRTVTLGEPLMLQADASGATPITYRWFRDGVLIPGTMSAQVVDSAGLADAGEYQVEARNALGSSRSGKVKVRVLIPGEPDPGADPGAGGAGPALQPVPVWAPGKVPAGVLPAVTLLPHLTYVPSQRDQGQCGNCYAWAAHAAMEMELFRKYGIKDQLSVQFFNSVYRPLRAGDPPDPCCKANPELVARTYLRADVRRLIPWNNPNAQFQDGVITCTDCEEKGSPQPEVKGSRAGRAAIPTEPCYPLLALSFAEYNVTDPPRSQAQVQTYIRQQLNQGKLVIYNNSRHYTVIVGYDDRPAKPYWIILDSFGASPSQPRGSRNVLMEAINFTATQGLAVTNSIEVLNELELDLHGQGVVSEVRATPESVDAAEGQPLTLTARVKAYPPVQYAWSKAGQALGANEATLVIPRLRPADAGIYEVRATLSNGATRTSGHVPVTVQARSGALTHALGLETGVAASGLAVRVIPERQDLADGGDFTLLSVVVRGRGPFKYRWLFRGHEIPHESGPNLLVHHADTGRSGAYQVELSNGPETVLSAPAQVTVRPGRLGREEKKDR